MNEKIRILFLAANPIDTVSRLHLDKEISEMTEKIRSSLHGDCLELISEWSVKPGALQGALFRHKPHILHFSGHGSREYGLTLENDLGHSVSLSRQVFTRLLKLAKCNIRIVVLNACHTKEQAEFLKETIDFTIGMNRPIGDKAARVFSAYFYQGLAFGLSVPDAFESGLIQMEINETRQSDIPELHIRRGFDPSQPFLPVGDIQKDEEPGPATLWPGENGGGDRIELKNTAEGGDINIEGGQYGQVKANRFITRSGKKQ